jgi:hypothetical protein
VNESAERIPAGDEQAGMPCGWCGEPLAAGATAAVCAECSSLHHEACWDNELGCSRTSCLNAPLPRLDRKPAPAAVEPDEPGEPSEPDEPSARASNARPRKKTRALKRCIGCDQELMPGEEVCDACFAINTPDGLYHGPKKTHPPAREALIMAIAGIFLCGPILGGLAIGRANKAREEIRRDPRLTGDGLALAAIVIAVVEIALWAIGILSRAGGRP